MHFGSNYLEFGWLFVLVGQIFIKRIRKFFKKNVNKTLNKIFFFFLNPNWHQAKSGVFSWWVVGGGGGGIWGKKIKIAQNGLKHVLILEFLKFNEIFWNFVFDLTTKQASIHQHVHHSDQISRSAHWGGAIKNPTTYVLLNTCWLGWPWAWTDPVCDMIDNWDNVRSWRPITSSSFLCKSLTVLPM